MNLIVYVMSSHSDGYDAEDRETFELGEDMTVHQRWKWLELC